MAKYQATYRAGTKLSDEYVDQLKADVEKYDSFSDFVNAIYKENQALKAGGAIAAEPAPSAVAAPPAPVVYDDAAVLSAVADAKADIVEKLSSMLEDLRSVAEDTHPAVATATVDISDLATHDALAEHKFDIVNEIIKSHQLEMSRMDMLIKQIENMTASIAPVAAVAAPAVVATSQPAASATAPASTPMEAPTATPDPIESVSAPVEPVAALATERDVVGEVEQMSEEPIEEPSMSAEEMGDFFDTLVNEVSTDLEEFEEEAIETEEVFEEVPAPASVVEKPAPVEDDIADDELEDLDDDALAGLALLF